MSNSLISMCTQVAYCTVQIISSEIECYAAQRSNWRNMLSLSNFDKDCVNTKIELFDKINNCLIYDWFILNYQNFIAYIFFIKYH